MDPIRQALERARTASSTLQGNSSDLFAPLPSSAEPQQEAFRDVKLNAAHLASSRIVAYNPVHEGGRYFDVLRTQVLQSMADNGWQILAVTSPTAGCGKSVTACNLAMSIARLPERSVLLVDLDLQKPKVAEYLGVNAKSGLLSVLEGRAGLLDVIVQASIGQNKMLVLPGESCKSGSAEWMASQAMTMTVAGSQKGFPIARDHPGYAAGSGRRRPHFGLAPNRIGAADYQHRDVDVARHQGVLQTHQIHTDRTRRGQ